MSKKVKPNDDAQTQEVVMRGGDVLLAGYTGHGDVPENITHVIFHPSVINTNNEVFKGCSQLRDVTLNEGLREIGEHAFHGCTSLERIILPSTVSDIGYVHLNDVQICSRWS